MSVRVYNYNGAGVRMGRRNCLKATKDFFFIFALLNEIEFGSEVLLGKLQWQPMHFCFTFLPLFLMKLLLNQLISQFSLFPVVKLQMGRLWPYVTINTHRIVYFLMVGLKNKNKKKEKGINSCQAWVSCLLARKRLCTGLV